MPGFSLLTPVASAILGAVAIRTVEIISERRSGVSAIHHQIVENYWRLEGQIEEIERGDWTREYTQEVRLDGIEAVKARSPEVYIRMVNEATGFPAALASLENLRRVQLESRRAEAYVQDDEEEVVERLREIQRALAEAEDGIIDYKNANILRRILLLRTLEPSDLNVDQ